MDSKYKTNSILKLYHKKLNISEIAKILKCSNITVWNHLKIAGVDINQRFCLNCKKKYVVNHKFNKWKICPECQEKISKQVLRKWLKKNSKKLKNQRKKWRQKHPHRKLNWVNLHKTPKHILLRDKIEVLLKKGISEKEIAKKLNLRLGKDSRDRFSVKWYEKCIKSKISGKKVQKLYPNIRKNLPSRASVKDRRNGALSLIKKLKKEGRYKQHQRKAGKLGGLIGGPASMKKQRENRPYYFMNSPFDSEQEKDFCRLLVKHNIISRPTEGKNVHVPIGRSKFDFLIKNRFIEYHPFDLNKNNQEYFLEQRRILNRNGFKNYPLVIIKSPDEFYIKILPLFKKAKKNV